MKIDYLIIGQGLAGSLLARELILKKKKVIIVDDANPASASRVASGLINPITGKRLKKTWMAEQLFAFAHNYYTEIEHILKGTFFHPLPIVRFFVNAQQANDWDVNSVALEMQQFIDKEYKFSGAEFFKNTNGFAVYKQGAVLDVAIMLALFRSYFESQNIYRREELNYNSFKMGEKIRWKDIKTSNVVFCEGWKAWGNNPWFKDLPFLPSKGDVLTLNAKFKLNEIITRGIYIRPFGESLLQAGSTYNWQDLSSEPKEDGKKELSEKLQAILKNGFEIIDHKVAIRPTVQDRRPFLGSHPKDRNIHIFNGLGTKGVLLAPYFAQQLADHLVAKKEIIKEVDVARYF